MSSLSQYMEKENLSHEDTELHIEMSDMENDVLKSKETNNNKNDADIISKSMEENVKDAEIERDGLSSMNESENSRVYKIKSKVRFSGVSMMNNGGDTERRFSQPNDTSDLRLLVEGKPLYVSRIVLSIISPVFKEIFSNRPKEAAVLEIPLAGKRYHDVVEFLNCVYPDTLKPVTDDNVSMLLHMATEYKVNTLIDRCTDYLIQELKETKSPDRIVKILKLSDLFDITRVKSIAFDAATKLSSDILENDEEFQSLSDFIVSSIFLKRLKLLECAGKKICKRLKESEAHCALYHKSERWGETVCNKCLASVGKIATTEMKPFFR